MKIQDIKRGMVFIDNDPRALGRTVTIESVDYNQGIIVFAHGTRSRRPERFYTSKRSRGYTLVQPEPIA